jgi:chitodextrinase
VGCTSFAQIATPTGTTYNDTGVVLNTTYSYRERATDASGNLSPYSNVASATTSQGTISGLVAAYAFDEGTGTTVADASGNGNTGTITNATWTTGKYGNGLSFNGSNALVTINDSALLHLTTAMTLEAWVKPGSTVNKWEDIVYKGDDNYFLEATSNKNVPAGAGTFGTTDVAAYGTSALPKNTWTHLAVTYDGARLLLYVNRVQVSSLARTGT